MAPAAVGTVVVPARPLPRTKLDLMAPDETGYAPRDVERKWQERWETRGTHTFTLDELKSSPAPYYNLMMFPYPSAEGLHVGNIYAFTGADVHGRYQRLLGHDVFEPIGFDAFGIHSENFALKVGVHPMDLIPSNVENFTRQLRQMGGMFDWNHTVDTTDPGYYRWTQWVFLKLFEAGLAERKEAPVNWCPSCKTVLANEQVVGGRCERCDTPVEQRRIAQWFFRITEYQQRLLDNLDDLDWSEVTTKAQANWLGRSEGAEVAFPLITDGATAAVDPSTVRDAGDDAIRVYTTRPDTIFGATFMVLAPEHPAVDRLTAPAERPVVEAYRQEVQRTDLVARKTSKEKTGVFTGGYCRNPATGEAIPVWIADYVLMDYGTGAVMAVPGHDQRDFEFASEMKLPIRRVVAGPDQTASTPLDEAWTGDGVMVNSGPFDGMTTAEAIPAVTDWLAERAMGERKVNFRLHDWCISRQRYWGPPIPIVHCDDCGAVPVPEDELPVVLPRIDDFTPDDSGVSPLARVREWYETECPRCGGPGRRETDVSDTFLDSGWYFLRYPSTDFDDRAFDPGITRRWLPVDCYIGGNEHAVLHLLYSRFLTMVLHDLGLLDFEEPFTRFRAHGLIIREGAKMSKSRGNVIVPDPIIENFGADTFRLYLMFLGPFEEGGDYRDDGIQGPHGFLHRLWTTVTTAEERAPDPKVERKLHQTIRQVTEQLPELGYNTSIAALMEYLNVVRAGGRTAALAEVEPLVLLVAPFCPHIAEELWERLGHADGLFDAATWPTFDPETAREVEVEVAVQVNGKLRGTVLLEADADATAAEAAARAEANVARHLDGVTVRRVIHVPNRLVNFVVG